MTELVAYSREAQREAHEQFVDATTNMLIDVATRVTGPRFEPHIERAQELYGVHRLNYLSFPILLWGHQAYSGNDLVGFDSVRAALTRGESVSEERLNEARAEEMGVLDILPFRRVDLVVSGMGVFGVYLSLVQDGNKRSLEIPTESVNLIRFKQFSQDLAQLRQQKMQHTVPPSGYFARRKAVNELKRVSQEVVSLKEDRAWLFRPIAEQLVKFAEFGIAGDRDISNEVNRVSESLIASLNELSLK